MPWPVTLLWDQLLASGQTNTPAEARLEHLTSHHRVAAGLLLRSCSCCVLCCAVLSDAVLQRPVLCCVAQRPFQIAEALPLLLLMLQLVGQSVCAVKLPC